MRTDSLALLGTMSYEKGQFAFFDGSNSDYRKVVQPEENIAGFKVASVAPNCVRLEGTNEQRFDLCVGMRMSKREGVTWRVSDEPAEASGTTGAAAPKSGGGSGGADDDIVKRMMQRRDQEGGAPAESASPVSVAPAETKPASATSEGDDALKRLLQKREQELNK